nr:hypothetical protein GCM10010200_100230 [Actinomadura rugatobispora]
MLEVPGGGGVALAPPAACTQFSVRGGDAAGGAGARGHRLAGGSTDPLGAPDRAVRADQKITKELVNAFERVTGKENILSRITDVSLTARSSSQAFSVAQAKSVGGLAEPAGEVVVQVLLIVADPGDMAVGT